MNHHLSDKAFKEALDIFPGGVNSPVRAFKAVGGSPIFIEKAKGANIFDIDGNKYIDYVLSWGPMILGHAHDKVIENLKESLELGTSYGAPNIYETKLGQLIKDRLPYIERVRMVNSGTEATMSAVRVARGVTGRNKIVKFNGCYHGHSDSFLVQAGSGVATLGLPNSPGVPLSVANETISLPFNDHVALKEYFEDYGEEIACIILEVVAGNMGLIPANDSFINTIKQVIDRSGALLIVDEVMSGFRAHYQGAVALYHLQPDLVTLGKVVGGGFPMAAFAGKKKYMDSVAPLGTIYQAGTLSGNPIAMRAGYETLSRYTMDDFNYMSKLVDELCSGLKMLSKRYNVPMQVVNVGTMFGFFFNEYPVTNFEDSKLSDHELFAKVHRMLLNRGIYLAPSQYESNFISSAHTHNDIEHTLQAFEDVFEVIYG